MTSQDTSAGRHELLLAEVTRPIRDFLRTETGSAGILLVAAVVAVIWANSPFSDSYFSLWDTEASVELAGHAISMDLGHWVNDGLMVIFFFVIGLELRYEMSVGEFRRKRTLLLPAIGGVGGLIVPAALYLLINPSDEAARGWGVVIGTDTAFLLGALALVGPRASTQLRMFLLTMTIADDLLAVAIIGIVYSDSIDLLMVAIAATCLASIAWLGRVGAWETLIYLLAGVVAWMATLESGLHPSIIGMLAGLLVASHAPRRDAIERAARLFQAFRQSPLPGLGYSARRGLQRAISPNERFQEILHPWTSFLIVPMFALANAGVDLRGGVLGEALTSPITWGVVVGLVVGKPIGIGLSVLGAQRFGLGTLPRNIGPGQLVAGGALSGLGFSVSLLIVVLAFDDPGRQQEATVGVLMACVLSAAMGWVIFQFSAIVLGERSVELPTKLDPPVDVDRDHIRGRPDAPLTLVEYGNFECHFCGTATHVVEDLRARFGDDLRYVFRHLPLPDVHRHSEMAAVAAEAAGEQGRFWEMHDMLYRHQDQLEVEDLIGYAGALELEIEEFARVLTEERPAERIREDVLSAELSGARRTPTFFVGDTRHVGPWDTESLAAKLEALRRGLPEAENAGVSDTRH